MGIDELLFLLYFRFIWFDFIWKKIYYLFVDGFFFRKRISVGVIYKKLF